MAEQKFLGEAGTDVLVQKIKDNEKFFQIWKADIYSVCNLARDAAKSTKIYVMFENKAVHIQYLFKYIKRMSLYEPVMAYLITVEFADVQDRLNHPTSNRPQSEYDEWAELLEMALTDWFDAKIITDGSVAITVEQYIKCMMDISQMKNFLLYPGNEIRYMDPAGTGKVPCYWDGSAMDWIPVPANTSAVSEITAADVTSKFA